MCEKIVLIDALETFGKRQIVKCMEEMSELTKELCKYYFDNTYSSGIAEEIADTEIMLEQMKIYFGCSDLVKEYRKAKVERLKRRLEEIRCKNRI